MNLGQAKKILNKNTIQDIIAPMSRKTGTANIPAKTTPQAEAGIKKIYHGTDKSFTDFDITKTADGSIWFTDDINKINSGDVVASGRGKIVKRYVDENKLKLGGWEESDKYSTDQLISMGYDGLKLVDDGETTYQIFNPEKLLKKLPNPSRPPEVGGRSTLKSLIPIAAGASLYSPQAAQAKKYKQMAEDQALQDAYSPVDMVIAGVTGGATMGLRAISALADPVINYAIDRMLGD